MQNRLSSLQCIYTTRRYLGIVNCMLHAGAGDELECLDSRLLSCAAGDLAGLAGCAPEPLL